MAYHGTQLTLPLCKSLLIMKLFHAYRFNYPLLLLTLSLLGFPVTRLLLCLAVAMASHLSDFKFHLLLHSVLYCRL